MAKTQIIDALGEKALLLPTLLGAATQANERAKYVLALLQMAAAEADRPSGEAPTLRAERENCGLREVRLDRVIARSESIGPGTYLIPEAGHLVEMLGHALDEMLAPLALLDATARQAQEFVDRKRRLFAALPPIDGNLIDGDTIAALTSGRPSAGDGIHLLIMDLHKQINELQSSIAEEVVAGARAYGLNDGDRKLVAAFMTGLQRTAPLKFDHPGLATTAARQQAMLLIQNDIGETDAHVLVVKIVDDLSVSITYSDVHAPRLRFFQDLLAASGVAWEEARARQTVGLADDDLFYIAVGKLCAADRSALEAFLERLGSRIVFLIDWNRARKRLGLLVPNAVAIELLEWAAEREFGHRAFLQLGGERLIFDALEQAVRTPLRFGESLHEMIGVEEARDYLRFVLETAATGLRDGRSLMLIRDRIRAELFNHFRSAEERLLTDMGRHAALIVRLAEDLTAAMRLRPMLGSEALIGNAEGAKALESQADELVRTIRSIAQRIAGTDVFRRMVEISDDAADALEDAAFLAGIATANEGGRPIPAALVELADLARDGAAAFKRAVEAAPLVHRGSDREPVQIFLEAADGLVAIEHQMDRKERDVTVALMGEPADCRHLYLATAIAHRLEEAGDSLLRASFMLRDHILGTVLFE